MQRIKKILYETIYGSEHILNKKVIFMIIHVVEENQTLYTIANEYGVNVQRLAYDNQLALEDSLVVGQALVVLVPDTIHRVEVGDTIISIAEQYQVEPLKIYQNNPYLLFNPVLIAGEYLVISFEGEQSENIYVDGYVYPYVNNQVLQETLLYLTSLSIFSYGFTEEGELITIDDEELIATCQQFGVIPILVLTPFDSSGVFSNQLVNALVENDEVQQRLIENVLRTIEQKGYAGVNIDFEYVLPEDRERYVTFVQKMHDALSPFGYLVSVCLAPKVSIAQRGILYEGIDYRGLGEAADYVLCMTYEWGYTYGPAMAVSPINKVREVLDFAVSQIEPSKILMGMSNYGYDWALPYVRGESKAVTISNVQAIDIARNNNAEIQFDEVAQAPFFNYMVDGVEHEVWFEDARSIRARLELVPEYGLKGVGYWQLMKLFRQNFMVLNNEYDIERVF